MTTSYTEHVFINCPFDSSYQNLFDAILFAVSDCGFRPRCALEIDDGSRARVEKIFSVISDCKFGIHDISVTELDDKTQLPRFNMPLELGMFLGAKHYGRDEQKEKICLILDREGFRYQKFISDISGHDIKAHGGDPKAAIAIVRGWLRTALPSVNIPGGEAIWSRYESFRAELPALCKEVSLSEDELTFVDYAWLVSEWQKDHKAF